MKLKKCKEGHFYDVDRFDYCPYCKKKEIDKRLEELEPDDNNSGVMVTCYARMPEPEPDPYAELVVGWLVCIKGIDYGKYL